MCGVILDRRIIGILTPGQWLSWSRKCKASLRAAGVWDFIDGDSTIQPVDAMERVTWMKTNDRIVGALCLVIEDSLIEQTESFTTALSAWTYLKQKTHRRNLVAKYNVLQTALCIRIKSHESIASTIAEIKTSIAKTYEETEPTKDDLILVLLLQALSDDEFDWLRKRLMNFIVNSTATLSWEDIITWLEAEAQGKLAQAMHPPATPFKLGRHVTVEMLDDK